MSWPCPNGCPRDAGEYCSRHGCVECSETLLMDDGPEICNNCRDALRVDDCDNYRDYPREVDFGPSDTLDAVSSWDDISPF